jgi:hypothetical protein
MDNVGTAGLSPPRILHVPFLKMKHHDAISEGLDRVDFCGPQRNCRKK